MFTQCSKCETVFKLSADVLRAAGGQVRCGRCGEVFNALARLAEDASAFPAGESPLDMETRADRILHSAALPAVGEAATHDESLDLEAADVEFARLQLVDLELYEDEPAPTPPPQPRVPATTRTPGPARPAAPTESAAPAAPGANGTAAPGAPARAPLNRARVAPAAPATPSTPAAPHRPAAAARMPAAAPHAPAPAAAVADASRSSGAPADDDAEDADDEESMEFTLPPGELDRIFVEPKLRPAAPPLAPTSTPTPTPTSTPPSTPASTPAAAAAGATVAAAGATVAAAGAAVAAAAPAEIETARAPLGLEVPDAVRREMLAGMEDAPLPEFLAPRREALPHAVWLGAAIVLALALGAQIVHANRAWLAVHAPLGASLRDIYSMFGFALPAPANLSAYQLRQWGATGEPGAAGTLRVRASILNTAAQLQPYPLLRVTLANRFGSRIGTRDFSPAEYLGKPTVRMLAPGELADATLDIVDPGKDAEGFELDVCLRGADQKVICAADAATPVKQ